MSLAFSFGVSHADLCSLAGFFLWIREISDRRSSGLFHVAYIIRQYRSGIEL